MSEKREYGKNVLLLAAIVTIYVGIMSFRPNVDYRIIISQEIGDNYYYEIRELFFEAQIQNRGGTDAPLVIEVTLENAFFTQQDLDYVYSDTDTKVTINTMAPANQEEPWNFGLSLTPKEDKDFFEISFNLKKRSSKDIFVDFINYFYKPKPWNPTVVEFEKTSSDRYRRVK